MTETATMQTSMDSFTETDGGEDADSDAPPDPDTVRLIRRRSASTPQFHCYLTEETAAAGIDVGDTVAWDALPPETPDEPPMLVCQRVPESEADLIPTARTVSKQKDAVHVGIPTDVLGRERNLPGEPPVALGLDVDAYDPDNALHFQALVDEGVVALVPVGYDDGRAFRFDADQGIGYAVERVPDADASDHDQDQDHEQGGHATDATTPLSEHTIRAVADATGVDADTLADALDVLAARLTPNDLVRVPEYDPLDTDDGTVYIVDAADWERLLSDVFDSDALCEAVRTAHLDAAEDRIIDAGAREYRDATRDHAAVVISEL